MYIIKMKLHDLGGIRTIILFSAEITIITFSNCATLDSDGKIDIFQIIFRLYQVIYCQFCVIDILTFGKCIDHM